MLTEIAGYVEANSAWVQGSTLFLGTLPPLPTEAVSLLEVPGLRTTRTFDGVLWEQPRVRALVRAETFLAARTNAETLRQLLLGLRGQTLDSAVYIDANTSPVALYDRDEHDYPVMGFVIEITKRLSP